MSVDGMSPIRAFRVQTAQSSFSAAEINPQQPFLLLVPGATWPAKEWPVENWLELIPLLDAKISWPFVVLSSPVRSEKFAPLVGELKRRGGTILPALSLRDALQVTATAAAVITVDGGIMHAAIAMGKPTVALFGPTDPAIWFPYQEQGPFRVLGLRPSCHPCDRHACDDFICLPQLRAPEVIEATMAVLVAGKRFSC